MGQKLIILLRAWLSASDYTAYFYYLLFFCGCFNAARGERLSTGLGVLAYFFKAEDDNLDGGAYLFHTALKIVHPILLLGILTRAILSLVGWYTEQDTSYSIWFFLAIFPLFYGLTYYCKIQDGHLVLPRLKRKSDPGVTPEEECYVQASDFLNKKGSNKVKTPLAWHNHSDLTEVQRTLLTLQDVISDTIDVSERSLPDGWPSVKPIIMKRVRPYILNGEKDFEEWKENFDYSEMAHRIIVVATFDELCDSKYYVQGHLMPFEGPRLKAILNNNLKWLVDHNHMTDEQRENLLSALRESTSWLG